MSDLHVSACSKYNLLVFVDEPCGLCFPEGASARGVSVGDQGGKKEGFTGKHFCVYKQDQSHSGANIRSRIAKITILSKIHASNVAIDRLCMNRTKRSVLPVSVS